MKDQAEELRSLINNEKNKKSEINEQTVNEEIINEEIIKKAEPVNKETPPLNKENTENTKMARVITIASGKGGVGKSNFVLNVAISMVTKGKKVCIIDADFGMANISVLVGKVSDKSLAKVLDETMKIDDVIEEGPGGVHIISGGSGLLELSSISEKNLSLLIEAFKKLDTLYDVILIDTGAGAGPYVTSLIKESTESIIVTTPEPTSIIDAYSLIKIIQKLSSAPPKLYIAINRVESFDEGVSVYKKIETISKKYTGLELSLIGLIPEDEKLKKAVKSQVPLVTLYPNTIAAKNFIIIASRVLEKDVVLNTSVGFLSRLKKTF